MSKVEAYIMSALEEGLKLDIIKTDDFITAQLKQIIQIFSN